MTEKTLTLQETADRLGVHYMTVYRWVRTGLLPAVKDNGVWRVRHQDAEAQGEPTSGPEPDPPRGSRRRVDHGTRLAARLLAGDHGGAARLIDDALVGGISAEDLSLDVLADALRQVGEAWVTGEATIAQEHEASVIASGLIAGLAPHFVRRGRKRGTVVLGTVAGDHHGLPVALLAGPVRGRGHRVVELGANTPPAAFADAVREHAPVAAVGIFSAFAQDDIVAETVAAVRAAGPEIPVVTVGGAGIANERSAAAFGADGYSESGREALEALTIRPA